MKSPSEMGPAPSPCHSFAILGTRTALARFHRRWGREISMRLFLMVATAAGFAFATALMMADEASAVQDTPTTINGVEAVCTGVGSAKDDPRWSAYPVKIVLSTPGGANLANAHVTLMKGNQE